MKFYELAIGARFVCHGQTFVKTAMSMAQDERQWGHVFLREMPVTSDGPFLPPEEAARWKPQRGPWSELIASLITSDPSAAHTPPSAAPNPD